MYPLCGCGDRVVFSPTVYLLAVCWGNSDDGRTLNYMSTLGISLAVGIIFGLVMWLVIKWFGMDDD